MRFTLGITELRLYIPGFPCLQVLPVTALPQLQQDTCWQAWNLTSALQHLNFGLCEYFTTVCIAPLAAHIHCFSIKRCCRAYTVRATVRTSSVPRAVQLWPCSSTLPQLCPPSRAAAPAAAPPTTFNFGASTDNSSKPNSVDTKDASKPGAPKLSSGHPW